MSSYQIWGCKILAHLIKALLGKWLWHFGEERNQFWRWVAGVKYREEWDQSTTGVVRSISMHGCSFWKSIRVDWDKFMG